MDSDEDEVTWVLSELLEESRRAIAELALDEVRGAQPQPVCHHFSEQQPVDTMLVVTGEVYGGLTPVFEAAGVAFESDRLEAWETVQPDSVWLDARIAALHRLAAENGLIYVGWTWEPRGRQPVGACKFQVINRTAAAAGG